MSSRISLKRVLNNSTTNYNNSQATKQIHLFTSAAMDGPTATAQQGPDLREITADVGDLFVCVCVRVCVRVCAHAWCRGIGNKIDDASETSINTTTTTGIWLSSY